MLLILLDHCNLPTYITTAEWKLAIWQCEKNAEIQNAEASLSAGLRGGK